MSPGNILDMQLRNEEYLGGNCTKQHSELLAYMFAMSDPDVHIPDDLLWPSGIKNLSLEEKVTILDCFQKKCLQALQEEGYALEI